MNTDRICSFVAGLGPVGRLPRIPGTWGSLFSVLIAPFCFLPLPVPGRAALVVLLFAAGAVVSDRAEKASKKKDPGWIVIDELVGQWITLLFVASGSWIALACGFFFFRFFDILKPFPVKRAESMLPGGWSIMLDDVLAGIYAMAALQLLSSILFL
ncbi:MAG: phosphatidylglycerophosphatase A [Desulfonatronovibrionaceae bacterium]